MKINNNFMDREQIIYKSIVDTQVFPYLSEPETRKVPGDFNGLIKALCVLCFDDEIGQVTENIWPQKALDNHVLKNISGLGFPETNSLTDDGEIQFIFKVRQSK